MTFARAVAVVLGLSAELVLGSGSSLQAGIPSPDISPTPPVKVFVLPLSNVTGDDDLNWIGFGLQESVSWNLRRFPTAYSIELRDVFRESGQSFPAHSHSTEEELVALGRKIGVDILLAGSYEGNPTALKINFFAIDFRRSKVHTRFLVTAVATAEQDFNEAVFSLAPALDQTFQTAPRDSYGGFSRTPLPAFTSHARGMAASLTAATGSVQTAMSWFQDALQKDPQFAESWIRLGDLLLRASDYQAARSSFERTLEIAQARKDFVLELTAQINIGRTYLYQTEGIQAEPFYQRAVTMAEQSQRWPQVTLASFGLGYMYYFRGELPKAQVWMEKTLRLSRFVGDRFTEGKTLVLLGLLRTTTGDFVLARQHLNLAVELGRSLGAWEIERSSLNNLGIIALHQGAYQEAQGAFEQALQRSRANADRRGEVYGLNYLGSLYMAKGNYGLAQKYLEEALGKVPHAPEYNTEADILRELGSLAFQRMDYVGALAWYEKALTVARSARLPYLEGLILYEIGKRQHIKKEMDEAERNFRNALELARRIPDKRLESLSLAGLADVRLARKDYVQSEQLFDQAQAVAGQLGLNDVLWQIRYGMGRVKEGAGNDVEAVAQYRHAVNIIKELTTQFSDEDDRQNFLVGKLAVYDALANLLLKLHSQYPGQGYDREAWSVLEVKRGRIVAEIFAAVPPKPQDPKARTGVEMVQAKLDQVRALEKALRNEPATEQKAAARVESLTTLLAHTKGDYATEVKRFLARYPKYKARFVDQRIINPLDLMRLPERLPAQTLVVQYFAAQDRLYLFSVASGGRFQVKSQAISQADLYALIRQYRTYIEAAERQPLVWEDDGSADYRAHVLPLKEMTRRLSEHLLAPIEEELEIYHNLIVIPNDLLLYLPIHALTRGHRDPVRFLAETHRVSYATQQELIELINDQQATSNPLPLLAVANPDGSLPGASQEVAELSKIRPAVTVLEGRAATKERFLSLVGKFSNLHLATHGVLNVHRPELSYLLLAGEDEESQRLGIGEIEGLQFGGGLAVLSACQTAVGEQVPGAALLTLASAFSTAGARTILASLWSVEDRATSEFMVAFYEALKTTDRISALQKAQMSLLKKTSMAHPFYWAAFVLFGAR